MLGDTKWPIPDASAAYWPQLAGCSSGDEGQEVWRKGTPNRLNRTFGKPTRGGEVKTTRTRTCHIEMSF
jgi:hypothetical protein